MPERPSGHPRPEARWAQEVRQRLASLRLSPARETEIVDELSQHLDDRFRELIADGASPDEAERLALADFRKGDVLAREMTPLRQAHPPAPITPGVPARHLLRDLWYDVRYAIRTMARRPGFTVIAVASLAVGIGANTAIFSLWNGVRFAPLPIVRAPRELVILSNPDDSGSWTGRWEGRTDGPRSWLTYEEFQDLRSRADLFSGVMASQSSLADWRLRVEGGPWEEAHGRLVSDEYFDVLGVGAALGRVFTAADATAEPDNVVISHSYWQRRFGGRADVLGRTLMIRNTALSIVGVAPSGFIGETSAQHPDFWFQIRVQPRVMPDHDRLHDRSPEKTMWLHVFGRLKPGATLAQADAQANAILTAGLQTFYRGMSAERMPEYLDQRLQLRPGARGASPTREEFSSSLTALLAGVGVLLLIACTNLANLLLANGAARRTEMAVRLSLGASRARLVRQLLTESLVLAAAGGIAAIAVAYGLHVVLVELMTRSDSRFDMVFTVHPLLVAFVALVTLAAALLFGGLPAWQLTKTDAQASLKEQNRGAAGTRGQLRSGRVLVSVQLALSLPLLVGAGLLARTVYNLQRADIGFPAQRLALVRVDVREAGYDLPRRDVLLQALAARIQNIPGVNGVSYSQLGLFGGGESYTTLEVEGYTPSGDNDRGSALDVVGPRYFAALGIPIRLGRDIVAADTGEGPKVCVINEAFAKRFFGGKNPIGMHVTAAEDTERTTYEVIGVAGDAHTQTLRGAVAPRYFVAGRQAFESLNSPTFLIRSAVDSGAILVTVLKMIERADPDLPIISASSLEEQMAPLTAQDRTTAQLAAAFGGVALALAALGLYGVLSYGVARRTGEIAIRIALGAQAGRVVSMILRETAGVVCVGLALGGALAYSATRLLDSRLYGIDPQDPATLAAATALLLVVALLAAYLPARRASRLDPMAALRQG
jgi:putative ABC transport system permease protein